MKRMRFLSIIFETHLLFLLLANSSAISQTFVNVNAKGANNGKSWVDAYNNLDSALTHTDSGNIWVASGIYTPSISITGGSTVFKTFTINKKVSLFGGFSGTESNINQRNITLNQTILSGDVGIPGYDQDNTFRVVSIIGTVDTNTLLDGFIITKNYYTTFDANAAIYISTNGAPIIRNCTIKDNYGHGIFVDNCSPLLLNNIITNNISDAGAGIYLNNAATAKVIGNIIFNNSASRPGPTHLSGGGINITGGSPFIYGNRIENNYSGSDGGAIAVEVNGNPIISNNIISNNNSREKGGAIFIQSANSAQIRGNLLVRNHSFNGGALYADYTPNTNLVNNTIVSNSAGNSAGALYLSASNMKLTNNIVYNNISGYGMPIAITVERVDWFPKFEFNDIENGQGGFTLYNVSNIDSIWRTGNFTSSPAFKDPINYDFHLDASSGCINTGKPDTVGLGLSTTDITSSPRIVNNTIDLGCYEFYESLPYDYLRVDPHLVTPIGWKDSTYIFSIASNINWIVNNTVTWLTVNNPQGSNDGYASFSTAINPDYGSIRSTQLWVSGANPNVPSIPLTIDQSSRSYLFTTPDTIYVNGSTNDSAVFDIISNSYWQVADSPSWLHLNRSNGSNSLKITVTADQNETNNVKKGIIVIHCFNSTLRKYDTVVVIQLLASAILCPGDNLQLISNITDVSYQWQVDTGNGFLDIHDNINYSGTSTNSLNLSGIPSSFYGYRYRCLAGNRYSNTVSLQFKNTWTGVVSSEWENPLNWSCASVPDTNTDVIINGGSVMISSNQSIRSLRISQGVAFTILSGFNLTILH